MREADEAAARAGVVVRRALAGEIGEEEQRLLAGAASRRLLRRARPALEPVTCGQPFERRGGREDHAHLVPGVRQRMAEGVHGARRVRPELFVGDEEHARRAERDEGRARRDRADAAGRRRVVAGAAGDDGRLRHAPARGEHGAELTGRLGALEERRHLVAVEVRRREEIVRPVALRHVEPRRAGGIRHVGGVVAGEPEPHIVLRQQHLRDLVEDAAARAAAPRRASAR